jgi:hypothetical protein
MRKISRMRKEEGGGGGEGKMIRRNIKRMRVRLVE